MQYGHGQFSVNPYNSDVLMQTLPTSELHDHPIASLIFLHKQPPLLDTVRTAIVQFYAIRNIESIETKLDITLNMLWIIAVPSRTLT